MSRFGRMIDVAERISGVAVRPVAEVTRLEEAELELRGKQRELQDLAYTVLDYTGGSPQEMKAQERRNLVQRARVIHQQDPQYGGTINMLNEFVLGRGVPKPQANDDDVQKVVDRFWDDPDNKRILTSHEAQVRFNTDLSIQSNVFPLIYDDGDDGAVKLGLLDHDTVEEAVRDPDKRLAILWYFTKSYDREWDPQKHAYRVSRERTKLRYYEEFRNVQDAKRDQAQGLRKEPLPAIQPGLMGRGRVLHVAVNRTLEQAFGVPEIARTIRWLTAYNDLMRARVDMAKAAASIIAKRKLKGGAAAMQQLASQALMAAGGSATTPVDPYAMAQATRPGSILEENDWVDHQPFNLNSGGAGARDDAQMIRAQYSVATGWPGSYLGDSSHGNMATATSLELRVLKMVEARQQILEDLIGVLVQRSIQRAVEVGVLDRFRPMTPEEVKRAADKQREEESALAAANGQPDPHAPVPPSPAPGMPAPEFGAQPAQVQVPPQGPSPVQQALARRNGNEGALRIQEGGTAAGGAGGGAAMGEDDVSDLFTVDLTGPALEPPEGYVERDLDFQVSMPSPLRRSMGDLINAISIVAKTFDPNATNMEMSKLLLGIALGEGLEVEDPGAAVERIFPDGYVDPAVAAALGQQPPGAGDPSLPPGSFSTVPPPVGPDGQRHPNPDNPYGAPQQAQPAEKVMQQAADMLGDTQLVWLHARGGEPMRPAVQEAVLRRARERAGSRDPNRVAVAAGAQRAAQAGIEADAVLGPALAKALETVAQSAN